MKRSTALLGVIHGVCGLLFSAAVTVFTVSLSPTIGAQEGELPPVAEVEIDFSKHIKPILRKTCIRCHGPKKQKSEYRLDSREAALAGGEIGKGIIVGNNGFSDVYVVNGPSGITFLEPLGTGVVQTTTISRQNESS